MNLSILKMNYTMAVTEMIENEKSMACSLAKPQLEKTHYWHIEKLLTTRKGPKWVFVRELFETKSEAAQTFAKYYRGREIKFRLHHITSY